MTESAKAQWGKYRSLLASAKESVNHSTGSGSESSSVQLEAPGLFSPLLLLLFHLCVSISNHFYIDQVVIYHIHNASLVEVSSKT